MRGILLLVSISLFATCIIGQKTDRKLEARLREAIRGFKGEVGIYVKDLRKGTVVTIQADSVFPTASIVKLPILVGIMDRIHSKQLDYDSELVYRDSLRYSDYDILGSFRDTTLIPLKKIIMLMLTTSDNTASLWLQALAGGGARINRLMDSLGLTNTRVNSRTTGREENRKKFGWGQTTPAESGRLLEMIYRNQLFSPVTCDRMLRCLGRNYWDENEAISMIPPYIEVFSKNGCVDEVRSEVLLVNAPNRPYIFCVFTRNNKDTSWRQDNEAWSLARKLSSLLWHYFEPGDKWRKPGGEEEVYPSN